jgi:hypothetical protein
MTDQELKMIKKLIKIRCNKKTATLLIKDISDVFSYSAFTYTGPALGVPIWSNGKSNDTDMTSKNEGSTNV